MLRETKVGFEKWQKKKKSLKNYTRTRIEEKEKKQCKVGWRLQARGAKIGAKAAAVLAQGASGTETQVGLQKVRATMTEKAIVGD